MEGEHLRDRYKQVVGGCQAHKDSSASNELLHVPFRLHL